MSTIYQQMRSEHQNIIKVMSVLERELAKFDRGGDPDFKLMQDIVNYIADYPNKVHHPKEDLIFERLAQLDESSREMVEKLKNDHVILDDATKKLIDTLEEIILECMITREEVSKQAHEFLQLNYAHMNIEEMEAFPRIAEVFTDNDWKEVEQHLPEAGDPLFGVKVQTQYKVLYDNIMKHIS